jgi:hypothetical protein
MSKVKSWAMELQEMVSTVTCPECDGDGRIEVEFAVPHSITNDVGFIDTRIEECDVCYGRGEIELEDEDE